MIRYRYVDHISPPAPFVNLSLRRPNSDVRLENQPTIIDTAADRTILPGPVVQALGLAEDGRLQFEGFTSEIVVLPVYLVEIQLHDFPPCTVRAALGEREPFILLGRDALNLYRIQLDGPKRLLEVHAQ